MWIHSLKALFKSIIFAYLLPSMGLWAVGIAVVQIGYQSVIDSFGILVVLYFCVCAPVLSGYLAASYAPSHPIWHGLVAVALFMILLTFRGRVQPLWLIAPLSLVLGAIGARRFKIDKT